MCKFALFIDLMAPKTFILLIKKTLQRILLWVVWLDYLEEINSMESV